MRDLIIVTCLTWSLPPHSPAGTLAHRLLSPTNNPLAFYDAAGLTSRPHYDQYRFGHLTWIASSATDIDFQPQHMSLIHYTGQADKLSTLELIAHTDLPAADVVIVVVDIDAAAAIFEMSVPLRRNVVADADFVGIGVITDTDGRKALPAFSNGDLTADADLVAVGFFRIIRVGLDVRSTGIGRKVFRQAIVADEIVFVDLVGIIAFRIIVDVLEVPTIVDDVSDVAAGKAALSVAVTFFWSNP